MPKGEPHQDADVERIVLEEQELLAKLIDDAVMILSKSGAQTGELDLAKAGLRERADKLSPAARTTARLLTRLKLDAGETRCWNHGPPLNRLELTYKRLKGIEILLAKNLSPKTRALAERVMKSLVAEIWLHTAGPMPPREER